MKGLKTHHSVERKDTSIELLHMLRKIRNKNARSLSVLEQFYGF